MKKELLTLACVATTMLSGCMTTLPSERQTQLEGEYDKKLLTVMTQLKQRGDKNYVANAFKLMTDVIIPGYSKAERGVIMDRNEHRQAQFETQKNNGNVESFAIMLQTELEIKGLVEAPQTTMDTAVQQTREDALKTEYDVVLLALLDTLKQRGDANYLANAHKLAQKFVIPTFTESEQSVLFQHAAARHEQAIENGQYQPDFHVVLQTELELKNRFAKQASGISIGGNAGEGAVLEVPVRIATKPTVVAPAREGKPNER